MPAEPLTPFTGLPAQLVLSARAAEGWLLLAIALFWAIYTAIAIYHWIKYSHAARVALPAILVHLGISFTLLAFAAAGALLP